MTDDSRINILNLFEKMESQQNYAPLIELAELGRKTKPTEWLVEGVLAEGEIAILYGDAAVGKSYVAEHLAYCVASGRPWLGHAVKQAPAIIIDSENSLQALHRRLVRIVCGMGGRFDVPLAVVAESYFDLSESESLVAIEHYISTMRAKFLLLDSLMDFLPGRDENAVRDMLPPLQSLKDIARRHGCAIIALHHSSKAGGYRGTSCLKGVVDVMLSVTAVDGNILKIASEKMREAAPIKFCAKFEFATELDEKLDLMPAYRLERIDTGSASLNAMQKFILHTLAGGEKTKSEIAAIASSAKICSERTAVDLLYSLQRLGLVERANPAASRRVKAIFSLTTKGKEYAT